MATEIEPLIMPFNPLWVTTSKREYREAVRRMGEEPGDTKGKDGLTSCIPGKGCVVWISRKVNARVLEGQQEASWRGMRKVPRRNRL